MYKVVLSYWIVFLATITTICVYSSIVSANHSQMLTEASDVDIKIYPHQVAIVVYDESGAGLLCSGTIITEKFILAAASCFHAVSPSLDVWVRAGFTLSDDEATFQEIIVFQVCVHPSYNMRTKDYNIAVVELSSNLKLNPNSVWPAILPPLGKLWEELTEATIVGWGSVPSEGSNVVTEDVVLIRSLCSVVHGDLFTYRMICSNPSNFTTWTVDKCIGKVGDAVVLANNRSLVAGILIETGCADCPHANVYTCLANIETRKFIAEKVVV